VTRICTEGNRRSDRLQRSGFEQEERNTISKITNSEDCNKVGRKAAKPHMPNATLLQTRDLERHPYERDRRH